jgi:hypothetical protein
LAEAGLILSQGNQRDYVVIDHKGGVHALGQRILAIPASEVRARLADLDYAFAGLREALPLNVPTALWISG